MRTAIALSLVLAACSAPQVPEKHTRVYDFNDQVIEGDLVKPQPMTLTEPGADPSPAAMVLERAEALFNENNIAKAKPLYEQVIKGQDPALAVYATYKLGWVHFNLSEFDLAMERFVAVATARTSDGQPSLLAKQALSDTVLVYAEVGKPSAAPEFFKQLADDNWRKYCLHLVELYEAQGKLDAKETLTNLLD